MTRIVLTLMLVFILGIAHSATLMADVLLIEEVRQSDRMELPDNGVSMEQVRSHFGEPVATHAAIGDPPITRWDYDKWSVYFEYGVVLFTVLHKGAVIDQGSEPK